MLASHDNTSPTFFTVLAILLSVSNFYASAIAMLKLTLSYSGQLPLALS